MDMSFRDVPESKGKAKRWELEQGPSAQIKGKINKMGTRECMGSKKNKRQRIRQKLLIRCLKVLRSKIARKKLRFHTGHRF